MTDMTDRPLEPHFAIYTPYYSLFPLTDDLKYSLSCLSLADKQLKSFMF